MKYRLFKSDLHKYCLLYTSLFKALKDKMICRAISEHFKVRQLPVFESYLKTILTIRNYGAHGNMLYDIALPTSIRRGPAGQMESANYHKLYGAIKVIYLSLIHIYLSYRFFREASLCFG